MTRGIHERGIQDRRDVEQERFWAEEIGQVGCRTGGMRNRRDAVQRDRKGGMQVRRDAEKERCCIGGIGKVGCMTGGMKDWTDA